MTIRPDTTREQFTEKYTRIDTEKIGNPTHFQIACPNPFFKPCILKMPDMGKISSILNLINIYEPGVNAWKR